MLARKDDQWLSPYFILDLGGIASGENFPITYMDGNRPVPTYAHLTYSTGGLRLGLSGDFPVQGRLIPRAFTEVGFFTIHSSISVPKPESTREDPQTFFYDRKALRDAALGMGGGLALRWEFFRSAHSGHVAFLEFSASVWQTGAVEYLYNNPALNASISAEGVDTYSHLLADHPHFNHKHYQGYRFRTPMTNLSFGVSFGFRV